MRNTKQGKHTNGSPERSRAFQKLDKAYPRDMLPVCPTSGKKSHASKGSAKRHAKAMKQHARLYVYQCPDCQSYHVTRRKQQQQ